MAIYQYHSSDSNAPVLNGLTGSLFNVFKAIFNDGYGSRTPPAGWQVPFIDEARSRLVLRSDPATGSGLYYRIEDAADGHDQRGAAICGYETVADVDTGFGPFPNVQDAVITQKPLYLVKSNQATSDARAWSLICDERTLYWLPDPAAHADYWTLAAYFGDYACIVPNHAAWAGVISAQTNSFPNYSGNFVFFSSQNFEFNNSQGQATGECCYTPRYVDQQPGARHAVLGGTLYGGRPGGYTGLKDAFLQDYMSDLRAKPYLLAVEKAGSALLGSLRGVQFPLVSMFKHSEYETRFAHRQTVSFDGKSWLGLRLNYGYAGYIPFSGYVWLDLTGPW